MKDKKLYKKGQALLIIVLLLATIITVVLAVSFTSRTETKVSKLQQDSDRSLAAAEAGLEAAINVSVTPAPYTFSHLGLELQGIDLENSTVKVESTTSNFVSPLLSKDTQYTLYLTHYKNDGVFENEPSPIGGKSLHLFYMSVENVTNILNVCDQVGLELTLVYGDGTVPSPYSQERHVVATGNNSDNTVSNPDITPSLINSHSINNTSFLCEAVLPNIPVSAKLLFVRLITTSLNSSTRIGVDTGVGYTPNFPAQGKYFYSEAKTVSGISKKIQLFQSYPQIPSELFVTSFTTKNFLSPGPSTTNAPTPPRGNNVNK